MSTAQHSTAQHSTAQHSTVALQLACKDSKNCGFTLIELSIVLVVIGLMTMGIFAGKSVIHTSKLNSVIVDVKKIQTAMNLFKLKYDAVPGDMRNAYDYFDGSGGTSVCGADSTGLGNCNGNGNGLIDYDITLGREAQNVFKHLSLAKMIEGSYSGIYNDYSKTGSYYWSEIEGASFHVTGELSNHYIVRMGGNNYIRLSTPNPTLYYSYGVMLPTDAESIDKKMDDGWATTGNVRGLPKYGGGQLPCLDGSEALITSNYDKSLDVLGCYMLFKLG